MFQTKHLNLYSLSPKANNERVALFRRVKLFRITNGNSSAKSPTFKKTDVIHLSLDSDSQ